MKTVTFTQNMGTKFGLMGSPFRLPEAIAHMIEFKRIGDSVQMTQDQADRLKAAMPGGVEIS